LNKNIASSRKSPSRSGVKTAFHSKTADIDGIESSNMIRKGQLAEKHIPAYKQFMALAG
jgi:hypothetical protein